MSPPALVVVVLGPLIVHVRQPVIPWPLRRDRWAAGSYHRHHCAAGWHCIALHSHAAQSPVLSVHLCFEVGVVTISRRRCAHGGGAVALHQRAARVPMDGTERCHSQTASRIGSVWTRVWSNQFDAEMRGTADARCRCRSARLQPLAGSAPSFRTDAVGKRCWRDDAPRAAAAAVETNAISSFTGAAAAAAAGRLGQGAGAGRGDMHVQAWPRGAARACRRRCGCTGITHSDLDHKSHIPPHDTTHGLPHAPSRSCRIRLLIGDSPDRTVCCGRFAMELWRRLMCSPLCNQCPCRFVPFTSSSFTSLPSRLLQRPLSFLLWPPLSAWPNARLGTLDHSDWRSLIAQGEVGSRAR